jgi:hypothetical protein
LCKGKKEAKNAVHTRCLQVSFQAREARAFPPSTLTLWQAKPAKVIAAAAWYSFTAFSSAVETLTFIIGAHT